MARRIKDATLESREARAKLKARGKPYYRAVEEGLHLGYRKPAGRRGKPAGAGKWVVRAYVGAQRYEVETLARADDLSDADGVAVLNFWQAVTEARKRMVERAHEAAGVSGPLTVRACIDSYLQWLESNRKSAPEARQRAEVFIYPVLGDTLCSKLTTDQIEKWHVGITKMAPRLRTRAGKKQNFREVDLSDEETRRRRRSSANRILTVLKAALNRSWRAGKIASDLAWRRVEPFPGVDAARIRYLSVAEGRRLINACDADFRKLVEAALATGARYSELCRLKVQDFNADTGTIAVRQSKSGKPRHVVLTDEGVTLFQQFTAGRSGSETVMLKESGLAWDTAHQGRPMREACKRAKIAPAISFHILRHTWASLSVMNGVPLLVVAKNLGHADTRMVEKHYGHLAPSYVTDAIRAGAPKFGVIKNSVVSL